MLDPKPGSPPRDGPRPGRRRNGPSTSWSPCSASLVLLPVLAVVAALVRLSSPGPVLFRQTRVGRGRPGLRPLQVSDDGRPGGERGGTFDAGDSSRVTRVGRYLRATKLDELPQLWNVVRGEMSLVGPRPEVRKWVEVDPDRWALAHSVRPGITDPAAILYRDEEQILAGAPDPEAEYREQILPRKLAICTTSTSGPGRFWGDLKILWRTAVAVAFRRGAAGHRHEPTEADDGPSRDRHDEPAIAARHAPAHPLLPRLVRRQRAGLRQGGAGERLADDGEQGPGLRAEVRRGGGGAVRLRRELLHLGAAPGPGGAGRAGRATRSSCRR